MSYQVSSDVDGRPRITLTGEPEYCHALDGTTQEDELRDGTWLVMGFAVWSVPDVVAVRTALDAAKHFDGSLKVGLIPYDDPEDLAVWSWHEGTDSPSPHWVLLRGGAVRWRHNGTLSLDELIKEISAR